MKKELYSVAAAAGLALAIIAAAPGGAHAQQNDTTFSGSGEYDQITVRRNGNDTGRITVEINGDQVLVNGQKPEDFKGGEVTVMRRKTAPGTENAFAYRGFGPMGGLQFLDNGPNRNMRIFRYNNNNKAQLGVYTEPADEDSGVNGAKISAVAEGSAAAKSGLKKGDIITKVDDKKISGAEDLVSAIGDYQPGDQVKITYLRDGKTHITEATLGKSGNDGSGIYGFSPLPDTPDQGFDFNMMPSPPHARFPQQWMESSRAPRLGLTIEDQGNNQQGVKVLRVLPNSTAAQSGFQPDDVITEFAGKTVNSVQDIRDALQANENNDSIEVKVMRKGEVHTLTLSIPHPEHTVTL